MREILPSLMPSFTVLKTIEHSLIRQLKSFVFDYSPNAFSFTDCFLYGGTISRFLGTVFRTESVGISLGDNTMF